MLALPVGFRLHEYRIDAVLGQGGFGITYLATDVNLKSKVAIKEYLPESLAYRCNNVSVSARTPDDQAFYHAGLDSFLEEARTLATFRHPNIVRVARFFEAHRTAYMVLEYERGKSLKAWRAEHAKLPERELLALLWPLLDGLSLVHESGVLHRDIKPDNIYVRDEDGSLVLLDFGAARQTAHAREDMSAVYTPGYAPIEQYTGVERQGPWTDIYALGATLFWLVTGERVPEATQRAAATGPQALLEDLARGQYSPEFLRAIDWALRLQPQDRPQDIAALRVALYAAHGATLGLKEALQVDDDSELGELKAADQGGITLRAQPRLLKQRLTRFTRALRQPASWPIAVKVTLAMVFTALVPMLVTAYYNLNGSIASVSRVELRNLEQLAQSTAGRVSQLIGDSRNLADYLGRDNDFVEFLDHPTEPGKAPLRSKLQGLIKANPDVQLAMLMDREGTAVISSDPQVMGKNFRFRAYFQAAMQGQPYMTGIVVGAVAGQAGMFYSNPVRNAKGQITGAMVLRILGSSIGKILLEVQQDPELVPFLVDGDGIIIFHPDAAMLYKSLMPLTPAKLAEIVADQRFRRNTIESVNQQELAQVMLGRRQAGHISYHSTVSRVDEIAGYAPVAAHDWMVGVSESRASFEAPNQALFTTVLYSVAIVGAVFLLLAWLLARSIVKPIENLTAAAHALKNGDYDKATLTVRSTDEIGRLARTFNVMIDVLRQRERERERGARRGAGKQ
jgi:HAMP domain-containing protein